MSVNDRQRARIAVRPVDSDGFAPFGCLLGPAGDDRALARNTYVRTARIFRAAEVHTPKGIEVLSFETRFRPLRVRFLERHLELSQAFIPLGGGAYVAVVARPDAELRDGVPALAEIHAFLVPGDCGLQLHAGTWHEPPFPLSVTGQRMLITSHEELTRGLEAERDEWGEVDQLDVDKRSLERRGLEIALDLA